MKKIVLVFMLITMVSCDDSSEKSKCSTDSCNEGYHCNLQNQQCEKDCSVLSCETGYCNGDTGTCDPFVKFEDVNFANCIKEQLYLNESDGVRPEALEAISSINCTDMGITSIEGAQYMTNLVKVDLWENKITDISPLADATKLIELQLGANNISDATIINNMTSLVKLGLFSNHISSIDGFDSLENLKYLNLDDNQISDISPLASLTNLTWLTIENNPINDYSVITGLRNAGCDVYAGLDHQKKLSASLNVDNIGEIALYDDAFSANLSYYVSADHIIRFQKTIDDRSFPVFKEYQGKFIDSNGIITYENGTQSVIVGEIINGKMQLCKGEYESTCFSSFSTKLSGSMISDRYSVEPVFTHSFSIKKTKNSKASPFLGDSYRKLEKYVLASPNQYDAGSCVFMANTGAMEILMNQHSDATEFLYEGDTDLSERYLMNIQSLTPDPPLSYFITDLQYAYNNQGGSLLNNQYRFTVGYVTEDANGNKSPAQESDEGAYLSCYVNWWNEMPDGWQDMLTPTPEADRTIIFLDPVLDSTSIWDLALMNDNVVERIKYELRSKNAPVVLVYNHYLYWHADLIVGYDDRGDAGDCPFVRSSMSYFEEKGSTNLVTKIQTHMDQEGGCNPKGIFYVRDSIYDGGAEEINYVYSTNPNVSDKYSKRIITHSYDWAKYLGNHAYTVHRK